jgi:hypothetical protein
MTQQLTIKDAIEQGHEAAQHCADKANRADPQFTEKAKAAILAHLRVVGQCSGEVLTDVARASGARPHDDRAFGAVYKSLLAKRLVQIVGYAPRTKGHGCVGAKVYALVH